MRSTSGKSGQIWDLSELRANGVFQWMGFKAQKKQAPGMAPRFGLSNWKPQVVSHTSERANAFDATEAKELAVSIC